MKILYVARHDGHGNDDEGAIAHAFDELGHHVVRIHERDPSQVRQLCGDLLLFHHWQAAARWIENLQIPKVFWYFDLVDHPDQPAIRNESRRAWMERVVPLVDLGFCVDGDWAAADGKLIWLPQGADERLIHESPPPQDQDIRVLFVGSAKHGGKRAEWVAEMRWAYGHTFLHVPDGCYHRDLAALVARTKIVIAPDAPITDRYWSVRVYTMLGFGAFLLHPFCAGLEGHYRDGEEIVYYRSRAEMHEKIGYYLDRPLERARIAVAGLARTRAAETYRNRCRRLLEIVGEKL